MADPKKKSKNLWQRFVAGFKDFIEWVERKTADPEITRTLLEDLGLPPTTPLTPVVVDEDKKRGIDGYLQKFDPDEAALGETVAVVADIYETLKVFLDSAKNDQTSAWDVYWLITRVWVIDWLRVRNPAGYAVAKALSMVVGDYDEVEQFDPGVVISVLKDEPVQSHHGELVAQRWSALFGAVAVGLTHSFDPHGVHVETFYGWDPDPGSTAEVAETVSQRTGTLLIKFPGTPERTIGITMIGVTAELGGPGLFIGLSGEVEWSTDAGQLRLTAAVGAPSAAWFFLPSIDPRDWQAGGHAGAFLRFTAKPKPPEPGATPEVEVVRIGDPKGTYLDLGAFEAELKLSTEAAGVRLVVGDGRLVVSPKDIPFLKAVLTRPLEVPFKLGVSLDTKAGLRFEGGTRLRVNLPVNASVVGVFTLQYVEIALGPSDGDGLAVELSAGASLGLGPFRATIERVGLVAGTSGVPEGDFAAITDAIGFKPPTGMGLVVDAKAVKGGGFLSYDRARGEFAGALELSMDVPIVGKIAVKAVGLLTTRMPDGGDGWSLLLLLYAQFRVPLFWGFTFNGLGGIIGLNHLTDVEGLSNGLRTGVVDDLLFPDNPVADAPRILNSIRSVFPIARNALTVGPAVELGWGNPTVVHLRLAIILQKENQLGSGPKTDGPTVLLGQILVQVPPKALGVPPVVKLLIDVIGWYDSAQEWLFVRARLRDSSVAVFALTGELVVSMHLGKDDPSFLLAAGGFHPDFRDVPPGVPRDLDRIGFGFKLGPVVFAVKIYFAVTSNTKQVGFDILIQAKLGPVSIEGFFGFDALLDTDTDRFTAPFRTGVALKFKGRSLCGVTLKGTLTGPGEYHAVGSGSFSILFWDVDFGFDEWWGDAPELGTTTTELRRDVQRDLSDVTNWNAALPAGTDTMVTVVQPVIDGQVVAHPMGRLSFLQRRVPFGIEVHRLGTQAIAGGPVTFAVTAASLGTQANVDHDPVSEHFARGLFVDLSDEQRISTPAFERFDAGVLVGASSYRVPGAAGLGRAPLKFEDAYLVEEDDHSVVHRPGIRHLPDLGIVLQQAERGGSGRSSRNVVERLRGDLAGRISITAPPMTVVDAERLGTVAGVEVLASVTAGEQAVATRAGTLLVEAFELVAH
jgi:hypothetical protein